MTDQSESLINEDLLASYLSYLTTTANENPIYHSLSENDTRTINMLRSSSIYSSSYDPRDTSLKYESQPTNYEIINYFFSSYRSSLNQFESMYDYYKRSTPGKLQGNLYSVQLAVELSKKIINDSSDSVVKYYRYKNVLQDAIDHTNTMFPNILNGKCDGDTNNSIKAQNAFAKITKGIDFMEMLVNVTNIAVNINKEKLEDIKRKPRLNVQDSNLYSDIIPRFTYSDDYVLELVEYSGKQYPVIIFKNSLVVIDEGGYRFIRCGRIYLVINNNTGKKFVMHSNHYVRSIHLLQVFSSLSLISHKLSPNPVLLISNIIDLYGKLSLIDPNMIGSYFKAAKTYYCNQLEESKIISDNASLDFLTTLNDDRLTGTNLVISIIDSQEISLINKVQLCNVYKSGPHPDSNMNKAFESVLGFHEPNSVDPNMFNRFKSHLRKEIFLSLFKTGKLPRIQSTDDSSLFLQVLSNRSSLTEEQIRKTPVLAWSNTKFEINPNITHPSAIEVPISNKSSQKERPDHLDKETLNKLRDEYIKTGSKDGLLNLQSSNDHIAHIQEGYTPDYDKSVSRMLEIIKEHEAFESSYTSIDDIPYTELADFVYQSNYSFIVSTEPKVGEYHKATPRLFYMAERDEKVLTQITERLVRLVAAGQTGLSIMKNSQQRRKDEEMFAHSMDNKKVFVSFDMTEFSKRFPMILVREYGSILSELTGERWLARVDLFFRAAIVINNNRGYFTHTAGVCGGFEGFLNFMWSSIHAIIMEISLESTGTRGHLLTFSDDGILMFNPPLGDEKIDTFERIKNIQKTYSDLGLEFNLHKTMVSRTVWEYLGDVCYNRRILTSWVKELCSVGRSLRDKTFKDTSTKLDIIIGQCKSLISSGAPGYQSFLIMSFMIFKSVKGVVHNYKSDIIKAMFITPRNAGGLGVPSYTQMIAGSSVSQYSHYIDSLLLYTRLNPKVSYISMTYVSTNIIYDPTSCAIKSSPFIVRETDIGGSSARKIIEKSIRSKYPNFEVVESPLSDSYKDCVSYIVENTKNLSTRIFNDYLTCLSEFVSYNKYKGIISSSSALKLASRSSIKMAQSRDSYVLKNLYSVWNQANDQLRHYSIDEVLLFKEKMSELSSGSVLDDGPPGPITTIVMSQDANASSNSGITYILDLSLSTGSQKSDIDYYEMPQTYEAMSVVNMIKMEETGVEDSKQVRKLISLVARYSMVNSGYSRIIRLMAASHNITLPLIPLAHFNSIKKSSKTLNLFTYYSSPMQIAKSKVFYSRDIAPLIYNNYERLDRTTFISYYKAILSDEWETRVCPSDIITQPILVHNTRINIRAHLDLIKPKVLDINYEKLSSVYDSIKLFSSRFHPECSVSTSVLDVKFEIDYIDQLLQSDDVTVDYDTDPKILELYEGIGVSRMVKWLTNTYRPTRSVSLPSKILPINLLTRDYMVIKAIVLSLYLALGSGEKKSLKKGIEIGYMVPDTEDYSFMQMPDSDDTQNNPAVMDDYDVTNIDKSLNDIVRKSTIIVEDLATKFPSLFATLMSSSYYNNKRFASWVIASKISSSSIASSISTPLYVPLPKSWRGDNMTTTIKNLYNSIFADTIDDLYGKLNLHNWDMDSAGLRELGSDPDLVLNYIICCKDQLRQSRHRSSLSPANPTSIRIMNIKLIMSSLHRMGIFDDIMIKRTLVNQLSYVLRCSERTISSLIELNYPSLLYSYDEIQPSSYTQTDINLILSGQDETNELDEDNEVKSSLFGNFKLGPDHARILVNSVSSQISSRSNTLKKSLHRCYATCYNDGHDECLNTRTRLARSKRIPKFLIDKINSSGRELFRDFSPLSTDNIYNFINCVVSNYGSRRITNYSQYFKECILKPLSERIVIYNTRTENLISEIIDTDVSESGIMRTKSKFNNEEINLTGQFIDPGDAYSESFYFSSPWKPSTSHEIVQTLVSEYSKKNGISSYRDIASNACNYVKYQKSSTSPYSITDFQAEEDGNSSSVDQYNSKIIFANYDNPKSLLDDYLQVLLHKTTSLTPVFYGDSDTFKAMLIFIVPGTIHVTFDTDDSAGTFTEAEVETSFNVLKAIILDNSVTGLSHDPSINVNPSNMSSSLIALDSKLTSLGITAEPLRDLYMSAAFNISRQATKDAFVASSLCIFYAMGLSDDDDYTRGLLDIMKFIISEKSESNGNGTIPITNMQMISGYFAYRFYKADHTYHSSVDVMKVEEISSFALYIANSKMGKLIYPIIYSPLISSSIYGDNSIGKMLHLANLTGREDWSNNTFAGHILSNGYVPLKDEVAEAKLDDINEILSISYEDMMASYTPSNPSTTSLSTNSITYDSFSNSEED